MFLTVDLTGNTQRYFKFILSHCQYVQLLWLCAGVALMQVASCFLVSPSLPLLFRHVCMLQEAPVGFDMCVPPTVCTYQLGYHWMDWFVLKSWEYSYLVTTGQKYQALYVKNSVRLYFWQQYKVFCISTVWWECIITFPWQDSTVSYCWQQNVAQEYRGQALLHFCGNTFSFLYNVESGICSSTICKTYCCISLPTMVMLMCHSIMLHVNCLSYVFVIRWVNFNFLIWILFVFYVWATTCKHCGTDKEIGHICVKNGICACAK